jgi:hypothetical protein
MGPISTLGTPNLGWGERNILSYFLFPRGFPSSQHVPQCVLTFLSHILCAKFFIFCPKFFSFSSKGKVLHLLIETYNLGSLQGIVFFVMGQSKSLIATQKKEKRTWVAPPHLMNWNLNKYPQFIMGY